VKGPSEVIADEGRDLDHCLVELVNLKDMKRGRETESVAGQGATRLYWVRAN